MDTPSANAVWTSREPPHDLPHPQPARRDETPAGRRALDAQGDRRLCGRIEDGGEGKLNRNGHRYTQAEAKTPVHHLGLIKDISVNIKTLGGGIKILNELLQQLSRKIDKK